MIHPKGGAKNFVFLSGFAKIDAGFSRILKRGCTMDAFVIQVYKILVYKFMIYESP